MIDQLVRKSRIMFELFFLQYALISVGQESTKFLPVHLPGTFQKEVYSKQISEYFSIYIKLPSDYSPTRKYPVVYILDGDLTFGTVYNAYGLMQFGKEVPPAILIGIAYKDGFDGIHEKRFRDFTPTEWVEYTTISGKSNAFVGFLRNTLMPMIDASYQTDKDKETLVGLSLGGLLATHILLSETTLFDNYLIASPSLWWDNEVLFKTLTDWQVPSENNLAIYTSIGSEEPYEDMIGPWTKFVAILENKNSSSFRFSKKIFENETHYSVFGSAFCSGIRLLLK